MNTLVRANRVSVQAKEDIFVATFYRTHKVVATVGSNETAWTPTEGLNKTAQRELYRLWVCENASGYGVQYDPADRREDTNRVPAKYTSDQILMDTACNMVRPDVEEWASKITDEWKIPVSIKSVEGDSIEEVSTSKNGKAVSPRYNNGNWAWARVHIIVTVQVADVETYVVMALDLVSGQMKKPGNIGELGYTFTGMREYIKPDVAHLIPTKESKAQPTTTEEIPPTPAEEPKSEDKPAPKKRGRKPKADKVVAE